MNAVQLSSWHPVPSSVSTRARGWLQNRGSLTQLIQQRCCREFSVKPVFQSLAKACGDELAVMNLRRNELALVREVYLYCGSTPVVFAHSVVARKDLRGAWRGLSGLGNKSLGTVLFTNPVIKRTALRFKRLNSAHPLFSRACRGLQAKPPGLWARRSLFSLHGQSILVTEVFLPSILELA
ncbi:chorismate--pyruvate lyase family protein [Nitrosovibrio sp. Nv4]|uniref:chorismate--pyruvate lyase family protein n=1 Tax=Nitrosovibrio sp. Nv4 TaxID=1945880 RepID=UPI000BC96258|nr:chorismate lyase [Nitrosovibrio sp. Nv4]SOD40440.1 chorismate lyase [Nitrosovibrio sp. Nv4]